MVSSVPFFNYGVRQAAGIYPSTVHNVKLFYDGYPFLEDIWVKLTPYAGCSCAASAKSVTVAVGSATVTIEQVLLME